MVASRILGFWILGRFLFCAIQRARIGRSSFGLAVVYPTTDASMSSKAAGWLGRAAGDGGGGDNALGG